jgi:hypothetical protein
MSEEKGMTVEELCKEVEKLQFEDTIENFEKLQELQKKIDEVFLSIEGYYPA